MGILKLESLISKHPDPFLAHKDRIVTFDHSFGRPIDQTFTYKFSLTDTCREVVLNEITSLCFLHDRMLGILPYQSFRVCFTDYPLEASIPFLDHMFKQLAEVRTFRWNFVKRRGSEIGFSKHAFSAPLISLVLYMLKYNRGVFSRLSLTDLSIKEMEDAVIQRMCNNGGSAINTAFSYWLFAKKRQTSALLLFDGCYGGTVSGVDHYVRRSLSIGLWLDWYAEFLESYDVDKATQGDWIGYLLESKAIDKYRQYSMEKVYG